MLSFSLVLLMYRTSCGNHGKEPACQWRWHNPWVGKILWSRKLQPTSVFLPGESMDRGAWRAIVPRVTKSQTWLKACRHTHTTINRVNGVYGVDVNYKLALAKSIYQGLNNNNNNRGICHLPLWRMNLVLPQLLTFNTSCEEFRMKWGILCSRESGGTGLQTDIFRNQFHDPNLCIFSCLEKH